MTVFVCGEEPEDIWCAIYDAWMSRLGHANVRIEPKGEDRELFCSYRDVETEEEKAMRVIASIRKKLSEGVYEQMYRAALSQDRHRADKIYRCLIYAFACGPAVMEQLQLPAVYEIFQMNRHLAREHNHMLGFLRFSRMRDGTFLSRIAPKNDITVLLAPHFAQRMPEENWIIYDETRRKAAVHRAGGGWVMLHADSGQWQERLEEATDEAVYERLWKIFHQAIGIEARRNPHCQMTMLPLRYRPYMTEFREAR